MVCRDSNIHVHAHLFYRTLHTCNLLRLIRSIYIFKAMSFCFDLEYPEAKELYTNAIKICPDEFTKEKSIFHANRAACLVKMV